MEAGTKRFGRFALVGVGNTLLTLAVFNVLLAYGLGAAAANAVGYTVGIVNSYVWNRRWTFGDKHHLPVSRTLPRFVVVNLFGLALTTGVVAVLEGFANRAGLMGAGFDILVFNAIELAAVCVGLASNFTLAYLWAFSEAPGEGSGADECDNPDGDPAGR